MSIYTQTSLKAVKKGDLVQLYLELQGKYNDIQLEGSDHWEQEHNNLWLGISGELPEIYAPTSTGDIIAFVRDIVSENEKLDGISDTLNSENDRLEEENKGYIQRYCEEECEIAQLKTELQEVKEAANRLLTASEQQVISLKEEQNDDSESNYKYITTLEDEVEELKTERDSWRSLAKCWEKKNEKTEPNKPLRDDAVESWAGDAGGEGFEGFDYQ